MNKEHIKSQIKNNLSTQDIIGYYLGQPNTARRWKCPFNHEEHNNNLSIKNGMYQCFSCGYKGDGIDFVQRYHKCDYSTALEIIAQDFHICTEPTSRELKECIKQAELRRKQRERDEARQRKLKETDYATLNHLIALQNELVSLYNSNNKSEDESFYDYIETDRFTIANSCIPKLKEIECYIDILYENDRAYDTATNYSTLLTYPICLFDRYSSMRDVHNRLLRDILNGEIDIKTLII